MFRHAASNFVDQLRRLFGTKAAPVGESQFIQEIPVDAVPEEDLLIRG